MKTRAFPVAVGALVATALLAAACGSTSSSSAGATSGPSGSSTSVAAPTTSMNIVQIAQSNSDLSTLVAAVQAAGLVNTLEGPGPFTVFAPTNAAFAALPPGTLQTLLQPANKAALTSILTYHAVAGALKAADVMPGMVMTVNGATFTVTSTGGKLFITDGKGNVAHIVTTDIVASNGVIHVIDAVLLPPTQ
ncbi:MAG TPA: fasciclin domain-containing protein [Candidatus Dormibacteraeota bacterium]